MEVSNKLKEIIKSATEIGYNNSKQLSDEEDDYVLACLICKFLREKYNIHIWIESIRFIHQWTYSYTLEYIIDEYPKANYPDNTFDTYNEALIKAIEESIKIIKPIKTS